MVIKSELTPYKNYKYANLQKADTNMEKKEDLNVLLGKYYFSYDDYKDYLTFCLLFQSLRQYNTNNVKVVT